MNRPVAQDKDRPWANAHFLHPHSKPFTLVLLMAYDFADDRLRLRFADKLLEYGLIRMQKSVFVGDLNRKKLRDLKVWINQTFAADADPATDRFLLLRIGFAQMNRAEILGTMPTEWDDLIDPKSTLFL